MKKIVLTLLIFCELMTLSAKSNLERFGDVGQHAVPVFGLFLSTTNHDQEGVDQLTRVSLVTLSTVYALKYTINAKRPIRGRFSFPSGHTAAAFMGAAYLHHRYGFRYGGPAYIISSIVGYSRVYAKKHYPVDVVAGAGIAMITSYFVTKPYEWGTVTPIVTQDSIGISIESNQF